MDPKFKAFSNSIYTLLSGIGLFFLWLLNLAHSSQHYTSQMTFNETITWALANIAILGLCIGEIAWGIHKFRKNRLPFKKDRETKIMTYMEVSTSVVFFSLLAAAVYVSFTAYYSINLMILIGAALVAALLMIVMYYDFLPEQVAEPSDAKPPPEAS